MTYKSRYRITLVAIAVMGVWLMWTLPTESPVVQAKNYITCSDPNSFGEIEAAVRHLQRLLVAKGYDVGCKGIDGEVGYSTMKSAYAAVMRERFNRYAARSMHAPEKDPNDIKIVKSDEEIEREKGGVK